MSKEELLKRLIKLDFAVADIVDHCNETLEVCEEIEERIYNLMEECDEDDIAKSNRNREVNS